MHTVTIAKPFALARNELTQGQWKAFMGSDPSNFKNCGNDCPVEQVGWNDAQEFVRKLSQKTGMTYRLPSEAEWEYACHAGGNQDYCGSDNVDSVAWSSGNSSDKTQPVRKKQANAWGLYDMSGNVWEWVEDCWNDNYKGAPNDGTAWAQGNCRVHVMRGGSWRNAPPNTRSVSRFMGVMSAQSFNDYEFRPARVIP